MKLQESGGNPLHSTGKPADFLLEATCMASSSPSPSGPRSGTDVLDGQRPRQAETLKEEPESDQDLTSESSEGDEDEDVTDQVTRHGPTECSVLEGTVCLPILLLPGDSDPTKRHRRAYG